jgi:hypothetical protein
VKFSIREAFKSAFRIFCQNFFAVFSLYVFSVVFVYVLFFPIEHFVVKSHPIFITSIARVTFSMASMFLSAVQHYFASFLFISALLPVFTGYGIKFRNCFPNLKKVFNYLSGTILVSVLMLIPIFVFNSTLVKILVFVVEVAVLFRYFIFFAQEVLSGNSVLQSCRNSAKLISGNLCKLFPLFIFLLGLTIFATVIPTVLIVVLFGLRYPILILTVITIAFLIVTPFVELVWIHVYTQLSLYKSNPLLKRTELETEDNVTGGTEKE